MTENNSCPQLFSFYQELNRNMIELKQIILEARLVSDLDLKKRKVDLGKGIKTEIINNLRKLRENFHISESVAREIMGQDNYFGREEIVKAWGDGIVRQKVPTLPIPFSSRELKKAKINNMMLMYNPEFTIRKLQNKRPVPIKYELDYFTQRRNYSPCWMLVTQNIIPDSVGKKYYEQNDMIVNWIRNFYHGQTIPAQYAKAIKQWDSHSIDEKSKMNALELEKFELTKIFRRDECEFIYGVGTVYYHSDQQIKLGSDFYEWTNHSPGTYDMKIIKFDDDGIVYRNNEASVGYFYQSLDRPPIGTTICLRDSKNL